jgi:hypothetical protein
MTIPPTRSITKLNGERKAGKGPISSKASILTDPKKMAQLGFEEGIGFIPFASIGWGAIKAIRGDDTFPIPAPAAEVLAKDPEAATKALTDAAGDKTWLVQPHSRLLPTGRSLGARHGGVLCVRRKSGREVHRGCHSPPTVRDQGGSAVNQMHRESLP